MRMKAFFGAIVTILLFVTMFSCSGFETGPDLPVDVQVLSLRPTTGDAARCCCQVVGTATNNGTVPVHITIKFAAFEGPTQSEPFASILYFVRDLNPGDTHIIDASGFLVSCSTIGRLEIEDIDLTGVYFPPE